MSSDFLVACFTEPTDHEFKPDWNKGRAMIKNIVKEARQGTVNDEIYANFGDEPDYDYVEKTLLEHLDTVKGIYEHPDRGDITYLEFPGIRVFLTGGECYGNDPTEAFRPINILSAMAVLDEVGFDEYIDYGKMIRKIIKVKKLQPLLLGLDPDLDELLEHELKG